jgi:hypothetical protein
VLIDSLFCLTCSLSTCARQVWLRLLRRISVTDFLFNGALELLVEISADGGTLVLEQEAVFVALLLAQDHGVPLEKLGIVRQLATLYVRVRALLFLDNEPTEALAVHDVHVRVVNGL